MCRRVCKGLEGGGLTSSTATGLPCPALLHLFPRQAVCPPCSHIEDFLPSAPRAAGFLTLRPEASPRTAIPLPLRSMTLATVFAEPRGFPCPRFPHLQPSHLLEIPRPRLGPALLRPTGPSAPPPSTIPLLCSISICANCRRLGWLRRSARQRPVSWPSRRPALPQLLSALPYPQPPRPSAPCTKRTEGTRTVVGRMTAVVAMRRRTSFPGSLLPRGRGSGWRLKAAEGPARARSGNKGNSPITGGRLFQAAWRGLRPLSRRCQPVPMTCLGPLRLPWG